MVAYNFNMGRGRRKTDPKTGKQIIDPQTGLTAEQADQRGIPFNAGSTSPMPITPETPNLVQAAPMPEQPQPQPTIPQPAPMPDRNRHIVLNPDGSSTVTQAGQTFNLTADETRNLNPNQQATPATPQVQALIELGKQQRLKNTVEQQLRAGATISQITEELLKSEMLRQGISEPTFPEVSEIAANIPPIPQPEARLAGGVLGQIDRALPSPRVSAQTMASVQAVPPKILGGAAQIIDAITSAVMLRKSGRVMKAEQSFTDASKMISDDIELVKLGLRDPNESIRNFETALAAINRLQATTKGLGKANLRYWLDDGAELETQIMLEKQILERQRVELLAAATEGQVMRTKARFGL